MINYSLTAITPGMGSEEVNKWVKQDCTYILIFKIACAYMLCCMLNLPVAFTVALLKIMCFIFNDL